MKEDPNTLMLFLRLGLSFGIVLGLVGGVTWMLRRRGLLKPMGGSAAGGRLEVLDRKSLGKSSSLVLARVGGTAVLLGVTGERIEVLSDRPGLDAAWSEGADEALDDAADEPGSTDPVPTGGPAPVAGRLAQIDVRGAARATTAAHPRSNHRAATHRRPSTARGARRTGLPMAAPAADRTRMSFIEALQELTVRRS